MMPTGKLIRNGLIQLKEDMESCDSFDPRKPYEEKDKYFTRANSKGVRVLRRGHHCTAEQYFQAMVQAIVEHERQCGKSFNKGMVYANLGIAQLRNGKTDSGIAHLLAADAEDRPIVPPDHSILNTDLWLQFEKPIVFGMLTALNKEPGAALNFAVDEAFLNHLLKTMGEQDRLFLSGTVLALHHNLEQNKVRENAYTWGRLYSCLKDLCLLTESLLRKRQIAVGTIAAGTRITLGELLRKSLPNQYSHSYSTCPTTIIITH